MSQPLVFFNNLQHSDNIFGTNFMQRPFSSSWNRSSNNNNNNNNKARSRKRKFEETDIDNDNNDDDMMYLNFIKPSNKRMRTNSMTFSNPTNPPKPPIAFVNRDLEKNVYSFNAEENYKNKINKNNHSNGDEKEHPYIHNVHPYLRNKHKNHNQKPMALNKCQSPEELFSKMNLNGFQMKNKQNENVNNWRQSIESQLEKSRNEPLKKIEELCQRIKSTNGLGKSVLIAKLRKLLTNNQFMQICHQFNINPSH